MKKITPPKKSTKKKSRRSDKKRLEVSKKLKVLEKKKGSIKKNLCVDYYTDPNSESYHNAFKSAMRAGYAYNTAIHAHKDILATPSVRDRVKLSLEVNKLSLHDVTRRLSKLMDQKKAVSLKRGTQNIIIQAEDIDAQRFAVKEVLKLHDAFPEGEKSSNGQTNINNQGLTFIDILKRAREDKKRTNAPDS